MTIQMTIAALMMSQRGASMANPAAFGIIAIPRVIFEGIKEDAAKKEEGEESRTKLAQLQQLLRRRCALNIFLKKRRSGGWAELLPDLSAAIKDPMEAHNANKFNSPASTPPRKVPECVSLPACRPTSLSAIP